MTEQALTLHLANPGPICGTPDCPLSLPGMLPVPHWRCTPKQNKMSPSGIVGFTGACRYWLSVELKRSFRKPLFCFHCFIHNIQGPFRQKEGHIQCGDRYSMKVAGVSHRRDDVGLVTFPHCVQLWLSLPLHGVCFT